MTRSWRLGDWLPVVAGGAIVCLTLLLWSRLRHEESAALARRVAIEQNDLRLTIVSAIELKVRSLIRLARQWAGEPPDRQRWEAEAALVAQDEACQAVARVDASMHVRWIVPRQGNEALEDVDLGADAGRRSVLSAARGGRLASIADARDLLPGRAAFLIVAPFSSAGRSDGAVVAIVLSDTLLKSIVGGADSLDYAIEIEDTHGAIYRQGVEGQVDEGWARTAPIEVRGLSWRLTMVPSAALVRSSSWLSTLALVAGVLTALLIAASGQLAVTARRRARESERAVRMLHAEVEERRRAERELQRARDELEVRVAERTASLRETNVALEREVERRQSAHRAMQLAVRELDHRVKNTLAMVCAVADQTLAVSSSLPEFSAAFRGRIAGLARIHEALRDEGPSLAKLIERTVGPHVPMAGRLVVDAEPVVLSPLQARAIGMALHELATNAVKHGAFSVSSGQVEVVALTSDAAEHRRLLIDWRETGGPPVSRPKHRGVGTTLIEDALAYELGGRAVADHAASGVRWHIEIPLGPVDSQPDGW